MKLERVEIENYRAIEKLKLRLDRSLTVLHGENGDGKTSVLNAIAAGLGSIPMLLPGVAGIGFRKTDQRGARPIYIEMMAIDGTTWDLRKSPASKKARTHRLRKPDQMGLFTLEQRKSPASKEARSHIRQLRDRIQAIVDADHDDEADTQDLPIIVFYDTDRAVIDAPQRRRAFKTIFPRYAALQDALSPRTNFKEFFEWFYARENEELRERSRRDRDYQLPELRAVRTAIERIIPGVSNPRVELEPLRFVVSVAPGTGMSEHPGADRPRRQPDCGAGAAAAPENLELDQMSGGYRIMLALAADLARRMAQGNPHLDDPLQSEAVVLIDEVDLHLHPKWQQRVLTDLTKTFPKAQFIVSTHSPQVLTTVRPERVVHLYRYDGRIHAAHSCAPTYGAEAGGVLEAVMEVSERPGAEHNEFVNKLEEYMRLIDDGLGRTDKAISLRKELDEISPRDSGLDAADMEMQRQEIFAELGEES